jgi:hypothetical protein
MNYKEIKNALIKCQNDVTTYQIPGVKPEDKKRVKGDMQRNVGLLMNLIPAISDKGVHKELHRLHNTYKQFAEKETDENLAAFQNELARIQEYIDQGLKEK